jgi:homoserine O-succinyltransferase
MTLVLPNNHAALSRLQSEGENVIGHDEFFGSQQARPFSRIGLVSIMPSPETSVTDIARMLTRAEGNVVLDLYRFETLPTRDWQKRSYLNKFHAAARQITLDRPDGLIIDGFGKEELPFDKLSFWPEFQETLNAASASGTPLLTICWASQAALFHHHGAERPYFEEKLSGVFEQTVVRPDHPIMEGVGESFNLPVSRRGRCIEEQIESNPALEILARSQETGSSVVWDRENLVLALTGHGEYSEASLPGEFERDTRNNVAFTKIPKGVFENDDPSGRILANSWQDANRRIFANWVKLAAECGEQKRSASAQESIFARRVEM